MVGPGVAAALSARPVCQTHAVSNELPDHAITHLNRQPARRARKAVDDGIAHHEPDRLGEHHHASVGHMFGEGFLSLQPEGLFQLPQSVYLELAHPHLRSSSRGWNPVRQSLPDRQ
ncbi:hypothetical protein QW131_28705 [Roseibium salinum]|nr:hypothetical protein [Roseibium salinum]